MQPPNLVELSVTEFVESINQTLAYGYTNIVISGELANFRVSKNQWVYFDLKDEFSTVKCFGTVYSLSVPIEDGMTLKVYGTPKLHNQYGFSFNFQSLQPVGEGSIKKAQKLLEKQLEKEGLFDQDRKRPLPYPPKYIGLIASEQSAAYIDFTKILNERWGGIEIELIDVMVQGELAESSIISAIETFNLLPKPPDILVITRGGGSPEDLWAFSSEKVTRAVAASRIPTLVAIGHEIDVSLAEKAADKRASTPSNAAELIVPDKKEALRALPIYQQHLKNYLNNKLVDLIKDIQSYRSLINDLSKRLVLQWSAENKARKELLEALSPNNALKRGYAIIRYQNRLLRSGKKVSKGDIIDVEIIDALIRAEIKQINFSKENISE